MIGKYKEIIKRDGALYGTMKYMVKVFDRVCIMPFRNKLLQRSSQIDDHRIVFESRPDFSDNARALFDYMTEHNLTEKYEIFWMVSDPDLYKKYESLHVHFIKKCGKYSEQYTFNAIKTAQCAKYVIYTHSVYWLKKQKGQVFVNLWHGCGYKKAKGQSENIFFDYCLVPGKTFVDIKAEFFKCDKTKILALGYPRYDKMLSGTKAGKAYIDRLKKQAGAGQMILWLPTFRKSMNARMSDEIDLGQLDLPLVENAKKAEALNSYLKEKDILMIVKYHMLQYHKGNDMPKLSNLLFLENKDLERADVKLYEIYHEADALLSDYSSAAVDYLLLDRPLGYVLDDLKQYEKERGFVFDDVLSYMPGNKIYTLDDLYAFVGQIADGEDAFALERVDVSEKLLDRRESYCENILRYFNIY